MKPIARKNAVTTSQTVALAKPLRASPIVSVAGRQRAAMPTNRHRANRQRLQQSGRRPSRRRSPAAARRGGSTASGRGNAQMAMPTPTTSASRPRRRASSRGASFATTGAGTSGRGGLHSRQARLSAGLQARMPRATCDLSLFLLPRRIDRFPHEIRRVRARTRAELLKASRVDFRHVEVAFLVRADAVDAPERSRKIAHRAP